MTIGVEAEPVIFRAEDQAVQPWQAEPYRLWSLLDMEKFEVDVVAMFAAALGGTVEHTRFCGTLPGITTMIVNNVGRAIAESITKRITDETGGRFNLNVHHTEMNVDKLIEEGLADQIRDGNIDMLESAQEQADKFRLPAKWAAKVKRIRDSIDTSDMKTMEIRVRDLLTDLFDDLNEPVFLYIPATKRSYFDQLEPPFGQAVADVFPDAVRDVEAATRCLALDEWTASVFHSMRVLEHGLRALAARFNVSFTVESWHKVIKDIEDGIEALRNKRGQTVSDRDEITRSSQLASQFRYFKDAWRNHVSHSRATYDEREALTVWNHVKDFMHHMAV